MKIKVPYSTIQTPSAAEGDARSAPRWRRRLVPAVVAVVVLAVGGAVVAVINPFSGGGRAANTAPSKAAATSVATVRQGPLSSQVNTTGTLGYAAQPDGSPYSIVNQASGTFTALPTVGQVVNQGQILYQVDGNPVILLGGTTPAYRALTAGTTGPDVAQLNADLVALGDATSAGLDPNSNYFGSATTAAVNQLQANLGIAQTGTIALGQAVFLPGSVRITQVTAALGTKAQPSTPMGQATSTARQVKVNLDASQQSNVKVGDSALVTLPNNQTTPGVISAVGTVASVPGGSSSSSSSGSGSSSSSGSSSGSSGSTTPTIPISIDLQHPEAAGGLDQAPVTVQITNIGVANTLSVPVNALLAQTGGGYAVETIGPGGVHRLVPVTIGLFDDADGLVQVTSSNLTAGQQVVVPSS